MVDDTVDSGACRVWRTRIQWWAFVGLVVVAKIVTIMLVVSLASLSRTIVPLCRCAMPSRAARSSRLPRSRLALAGGLARGGVQGSGVCGPTLLGKAPARQRCRDV